MSNQLKNTNVIKNALEYYDNNKKNFKSILKNTTKIKFIVNYTNINNYFIIFLDNDNNEIYKSKYEKIGMYNVKTKIWFWSWIFIVNTDKQLTFTTRKLLKYALDLDYYSYDDNMYLKYNLVTGKFITNNYMQIELNTAIASYISKNKYVLELPIYKTNLITKPELNPEHIFDYNYNQSHIIDDNVFEIHYLLLIDN